MLHLVIALIVEWLATHIPTIVEEWLLLIDVWPEVRVVRHLISLDGVLIELDGIELIGQIDLVLLKLSVLLHQHHHALRNYRLHVVVRLWLLLQLFAMLIHEVVVAVVVSAKKVVILRHLRVHIGLALQLFLLSHELLLTRIIGLTILIVKLSLIRPVEIVKLLLLLVFSWDWQLGHLRLHLLILSKHELLLMVVETSTNGCSVTVVALPTLNELVHLHLVHFVEVKLLGLLNLL